jgi:hypothetical protein
MIAKFWFGLRFFLENSTADWLFRGPDDAVINADGLESFLAELREKNDPLTDFVFRANCVVHTRKTIFPQGGSGYLMSRFAASVIEPLLDKYWRVLESQEDYAFGPFLEELGFPADSWASWRFCGHTFPQEDLEAIIEGRIDEIAECPRLRIRWPRRCPATLAPVRGIVMYHEYQGNFSRLVDNAKRVFAAGPSIMWGMPKRSPYVCRAPPPVEVSFRIRAPKRPNQTGKSSKTVKL